MKFRTIALLGALALTACAGAAQDGPAATNATGNVAANGAQAALPDADPAMWVVRDEDTTIYLFGTFHLMDGRVDWLNDEVRQAFDESQELIFEIDAGATEQEMAAQMQPLLMRYGMDTQQRPVSAELSPEQNRKLNEILATAGIPAGALDRFEPWFINISLTGVIAQQLGMSPANGAEAVLRRASEGRRMTIGAVETLEEQILMFDGLPREMQIAQLKETLDSLEEMQALLGRMRDVWNAGDAEGMERLLNEGMRENPALRRAMLENRNRAWAEWIDERMDRPGVVFMAVGAAHLVGPDSVQTFLRQRNIGSQRVPQLTPGN